MKRREFIKAGTATAAVAGAAGIGGAVGSACGGLFEGADLDVGRTSLPDMQAFLRDFDEGLEQVEAWSITDELGDTGEDLSREDSLARRAIRALYVTGMFGELPEAGQVHPGMQARIGRELPGMGETIHEMIEYLQGIPEEDLRAARDRLAEKSNPGMEFAEWIDDRAWSAHMSSERRLKTRGMVTQTVSRLKNQPPRSLVAEYTGKVEKLAAQAGSAVEIERLMIARMGERAFWEQQRRLAMYSAAWEEDGAAAGGQDLPDVDIPDWADESSDEPVDAGVTSEPVQPTSDGEQKIVMTQEQLDALIEQRKKQAKENAEKNRETEELTRDGVSASARKKKLMRAGGWCMGIGLLVGGLGAILVVTFDLGTMIAGMVLLTAGGILLLIGLITLIVGGIKYRNV